jgi:hypothetical protein
VPDDSWRMAKVWRRLPIRFGHSHPVLQDDCNENKILYGGRAYKPDSGPFALITCGRRLSVPLN